MRGRLRALGAAGRPGPDLPLRRAAPAALLLAAGPRRRAARAHRVQDRHARHRRPPQPDRRRPGAAARPGLARSSGPRSATSIPTTTPRVAPTRGRVGRRPRPRDRGARLRQPTRSVKRDPGPDGHGGRPALHRRPARRGRAGRRPGAPPVQTLRRRRVPGRLADPVARCSTSGWAAATSSASSATRRRRSTPSPAPTRRYLREFPAKFPGTTSIELVRNYRSTPEVVAAANTLLAGSPSRGVELRAQRPSGPAVTYGAQPRRGRRGRGRRRPDRRPARRRAGRRARSPCCSGSTPSPRRFEEALASRGIPYVVRGAARFFDRPEVRQAVTLLRGRRALRRGRRRRPGRRPCAAVLAGMGWSHEAPAARGQTRDRWESLQALVDQAVEFARARRRRRSAASSTTSTGGPPSSTPRSPTASPWPPSTPRRASSGTPSSWPASRRARCRSPTPSRPPRSRRSAGCSTSA